MDSNDILDQTLTLRPVTDLDLPFLRSVYSSTRAAEMALTAWSDQQKEAFITMQFNAQAQYYQNNYPGAVFSVVQLAGKPIGRLYLHRRPDEIRIMEITLLPEFRGRGYGTQLIEAVQTEGCQSARKVTIHVEQFNPARLLYQRLGFRLIEVRGIYLFLGWEPESIVSNAS